jgi:hypothetical protein
MRKHDRKYDAAGKQSVMPLHHEVEFDGQRPNCRADGEDGHAKPFRCEVAAEYPFGRETDFKRAQAQKPGTLRKDRTPELVFG